MSKQTSDIVGDCPCCGRIQEWSVDEECILCGNPANIYSLKEKTEQDIDGYSMVFKTSCEPSGM